MQAEEEESASGAAAQASQALQAPCPSEPPVLFVRDACSRAQGEDDCARCAIVCPTGALSLDEAKGPVLDAQLCTGCGICIGICDCFASPNITSYDFAHKLKRKAQGQAQSQAQTQAQNQGGLVLCCEEDVFEGFEPASEVVVLPCLAALSAESLAFLLAQGCKLELAHDDAYCASCARGGAYGPKLWKRAFALAQEWTQRSIGRRDEIPERQHLLDVARSTDRRELFTGALGAASDVASGRYRERASTVVEEFLARREQQRARALVRQEPARFLDAQAQATAQAHRHARRMLLDEACAADPALAARLGRSGVAHDEAQEETHGAAPDARRDEAHDEKGMTT